MQLQKLISLARQLIELPQSGFPLQVFHCREMQQLHQVHFYKPTMMLVLRGTKQISGPYHAECAEGNLILVSSGHEFPFANLPDDFYMALFIEFQSSEFPARSSSDVSQKLEIRSAPEVLLVLVEQLMMLRHTEVPPSVIDSRRKELAQLLTHLGYDLTLRNPALPSWQSKVVDLLQTDLSREWKLDEVCKLLATSESNLRRRLQQENTGFRELLEDLRLTSGLGLIQTTRLPINQIALECGYLSASRFSERFKKRFQTSPSELRQAL